MQIPLRITAGSGPRDAARVDEPVTFGVPLPRGACRDAGPWTLDVGAGAPTAVDVRPLERWPDGSLRWALVDARLRGPLGMTSAVLHTSAPPAGESDAAIDVVDVGGRLEIHTGAARFVIRRDGPVPFDEVWVADTRVLAAPGARLAVTGETGATREVRVSSVDVEYRGRLRTCVRVGGAITFAASQSLEIDVRLEFFAKSAQVRLTCTVRNSGAARHPGNFWDLGDPGSILIRDMSLEWTLAPSTDQPVVSLSVEPGERWATCTAPLELYQDSSGGEAWQSSNHINRKRIVPTTFRGYRLRAGTERHGYRATPAVVLGSAAVGVGVAVPHFWQNFPKALEASGRTLNLGLLPHQFADLHELQGGEQKTHECLVAFGPAGSLPVLLEWGRDRAVVVPDPAWTIATAAVDFLAPLGPGHEALVDSAIEGPDRFEAKREIIDEYGWRHFGEIYGDHEAVGHPGPMPLVSHYNNQYDPVAGFALQWLRTADVRWWRAMTELAAHVIDIDIYHTTRDKSAYNGGLFWHTYHYGDADTATHRTYPLRGKGRTFGGGPSADHNYPTGLMLCYFLTGNDAARRAAIGLAEYVIQLDDGRRSRFRWLSHADTGQAIQTAPAFYGPARASGNSLNALVDGHRLTGDARFLRKAEQLVRRVVHPADDIATNQLDEPEIRWFYAMFLQALGKYLHYRAEHGWLDEEYAYGRAALLHYARWMAGHEYPYLDKPEKLEFPTETWAAQDIRKNDIFCFAALHATGAERDRFVERASFFHRHSIASLAAMPTRTFARPVVVLLTSGFMETWLAAEAGAAEPVPAVSPAFGVPGVFVPQRVIALRRAKRLAMAGAVLLVAAAVALVAAF